VLYRVDEVKSEIYKSHFGIDYRMYQSQRYMDLHEPHVGPSSLITTTARHQSNGLIEDRYNT
jgi:hypothetical protein